tara:strand:+ start:6435 stop:6875 length:441 start_codon:yes stop_codon:yes gene_type:complete
MSEANINLKCQLFWPSLTHKNELADKYTVDLAQLSETAIAGLEDMGLNVNNKGDDRGYYITCKSNNKYRAFKPDGSELLIKGRTPTSEDDDPDMGVVVANGSEATCLVTFYEWEYMKKKGRSPSLRRMVISNVVEYIPDFDLEEAV